MKSRGKVDTVRGVDQHEDFKSRQWTDQKEIAVITFGILTHDTQEQQLIVK